MLRPTPPQGYQLRKSHPGCQAITLHRIVTCADEIAKAKVWSLFSAPSQEEAKVVVFWMWIDGM
jgi:hypothetical protein